MSAKRFPDLDRARGPAKLIEKVENRLVMGNERDVLYLGSEVTCWQPTQDLT